MAATPLQTALVSDKHDERQRSVAEIVRVRLSRRSPSRLVTRGSGTVVPASLHA